MVWILVLKLFGLSFECCILRGNSIMNRGSKSNCDWLFDEIKFQIFLPDDLRAWGRCWEPGCRATPRGRWRLKDTVGCRLIRKVPKKCRSRCGRMDRAGFADLWLRDRPSNKIIGKIHFAIQVGMEVSIADTKQNRFFILSQCKKSTVET